MTIGRGFDRTEEDLGNIVEFGHVNLCVPEQALARIFYVDALGLTRDPLMHTGSTLMWINLGKSQFHLPTRPANVLGGTIGLVIPDIEALFERCARAKSSLSLTKFDFRRVANAMEINCPWGNRFRAHPPDAARFGPMEVGMPYLEFDVPDMSSLAGIAAFYRDVVHGLAGVDVDERGEYAWASVGPWHKFTFRRSAKVRPFDGYHVQVTFANFSGAHRKLHDRGLVTQESDQHQYRFKDIVDPTDGKVLFTVEHEVRSMRHPLYGRALVNRSPGEH